MVKSSKFEDQIETYLIFLRQFMTKLWPFEYNKVKNRSLLSEGYNFVKNCLKRVIKISLSSLNLQDFIQYIFFAYKMFPHNNKIL